MSTSWLLNNLIAAALMPPLNGLLIAFVGFWLLGRHPRLGRLTLGCGLLLLMVLSVPLAGSALIAPLENRYLPLPETIGQETQAQAIVILGGGRNPAAPEYSQRDDVSGATFERLRYGAWLAKKTDRPILVSGGDPKGEGASEGDLMRETLARDFGLSVQWVEDSSDDTRQNALESAKRLLPAGIKRIVLVTHAYHMPRSVAAFEAAGFEVLPAPMGYMSLRGRITPVDYLPRYNGVRISAIALHEWIGIAWYRLRRLVAL